MPRDAINMQEANNANMQDMINGHAERHAASTLNTFYKTTKSRKQATTHTIPPMQLAVCDKKNAGT